MGKRETRASTKLQKASREEVEGWDLYRAEGELLEEHFKELEQVLKKTNEAAMPLLRTVHGAAKRYQLRINENHKLTPGAEISEGKDVALLYSCLTDEQCRENDSISYREEVTIGNGKGLYALNPQDCATDRKVSGYCSDLIISNGWFAQQNCVKTKLQSPMDQTAGQHRSGDVGLVFSTDCIVKAGTELTVDFNEAAANAPHSAKQGQQGTPRMPGGHLAKALLEMYPKDVWKCVCDEDCDRVQLGEGIGAQKIKKAKLRAEELSRAGRQRDEEPDGAGGDGGRCMSAADCTGIVKPKVYANELTKRLLVSRPAGKILKVDQPGEQEEKPRNLLKRPTGASKRNSEGTEKGAGSSGGMSSGGRRLGCVQVLEKGSYASYTALEERMQRLGELRLEEADTSAEASHLLRRFRENRDGTLRRGHASRGISTRAQFKGADGASTSRERFSLRGDDNGSGGGLEEEILSPVERLRDVRDRSWGPSRSNAGIEGHSPSLGVGTNDAGGDAFLDSELGVGGAIAPYGIRFHPL